MNKIQLIELLKLRGITSLNGTTMAKAIRSSGGEPSIEELAQVNASAMSHYIHKFQKAESEIDSLKKEIARLERGCRLLDALKNAGVDNWDGYGIALDSL